MLGQVYFSTPPLKFVAHPADANHHYIGRRVPLQYICIHDTDGTNSLEWLSTAHGSDASANRLVSRIGTNYKLVDEKDAPWTNGPSILFTRPGSQAFENDAYLTIEAEHKHSLDPSWPDVQVQAIAWQVVEWWGFFGFLPVVGHWQVQGNKVDPQGFPWHTFYRFCTERLRACLLTS